MEDYSQPFCIVGSKGKFHPRYHFYLPALEEPAVEPPLAEEPNLKDIYRKFYMLERRLNEIQGMNQSTRKDLQETIKATGVTRDDNGILGRPSSKRKYKYYT